MTTKYLDSIECSDQPLDLAFHPKRHNILAAALVDGTLEVHDILPEELEDDEPDSLLSSTAFHAQLLPGKDKERVASCRTVEFSPDGQHIYTGGTAGDLCCIDAERVCAFSTRKQKSLNWRIEPATEGKLNPLLVVRPFESSASLLATGDDTGGVRLWDKRVCANRQGGIAASSKKPQGCVLSWKENEDYISAIEHSQDEHTLLATSADGRLSVFDLRMARDPSQNGKKSVRLSDDQEDELLSLKIIKNGSKVVCGTQEGVLSLFSWGRWGDCSDRFPGHPSSIDALLKVDEDTLLTGSSDGFIRVVQIHPDKLLGVIGEDHGGFPVERLDFNSNREVVGSISHDNNVHLWNARVLQEGSDADDDNSETEEGTKESKKTAASNVAVGGNDSDDDWDDMDEDVGGSDSDDDSDDSDEDGVVTVNEKRKKRLKTDQEKFFDDL